jgi:release factor glutamine methyltransferase
MNTAAWLHSAAGALGAAGISTARLDCLVLLEDETGKDRAWLLSHPELELHGSILEKLSTKIDQRRQHIPLAYIRGKAEFYGREFAVNAHTLVPRPETETMLNLLKDLLSRHPELVSGSIPAGSRSSDKNAWIPDQVRNDSEIIIIDIGTGSGAIAITVKLEHPAATVIATDIDEKCLETARANARNLGADVSFLPGSLLEPLKTIRLSDYPTILLCNLPYVPDNFQINRAATHEPRHALFGGDDGLDLYRKLFAEAQQLQQKPQHILTESLPPQHEVLAGIAAAHGYKLTKTDDFIQLFTHQP